MSKILITGGNGMLGSELKKHFKEATALEGKAKLDLTNFKLLENYLKEKSFDIIIHTAAYTNLKYNEDNPLKAKNLHCNVVDIFNKYSKKLIFISAHDEVEIFQNKGDISLIDDFNGFDFEITGSNSNYSSKNYSTEDPQIFQFHPRPPPLQTNLYRLFSSFLFYD